MKYRISVLVFLRNSAGKLLLLQRTKQPNQGLWSPIGGKLEMETGESPYACAVRETFEETGLRIKPQDLHLFCMIAEQAYEGGGHWLMFLFDCKAPIIELPPEIDEGKFAFFTEEEIEKINIPDTDRQALWPVYRNHRHGFVALSADCTPGQPLVIIEEERFV